MYCYLEASAGIAITLSTSFMTQIFWDQNCLFFGNIRQTRMSDLFSSYEIWILQVL